MITTIRIAAAAITLVGATGAFALEGTQDFPVPVYQAGSARAAVVLPIKVSTAPHVTGEASAMPTAASTLERARVIAEAKEAQRLGLTGQLEAALQPTARQLEQIRLVGERAVALNIAANR